VPVDLGHFIVRQRLHFFFQAVQIVLGDRAILLAFLQRLDGIAADGADSTD